MKKFLKYLMTLVLLPIILFLTNVTIDFRDSKSFYVKLTKDLYLFDSLNVELSLSERKLVKQRIFKLSNEKMNIGNVVLGSSRSMSFGVPINKRVNNFSVSGGTLNDFIYVFKLLKKSNLKIDTLFVEISPWIFNVKNENENKRYLEWSNKISSIKLKKYFSYKYFFENITINKYHTSIDENKFTRYSDGTIRYGLSHRIGDNIKSMKIYLRNEVYGLKGFNDVKQIEYNYLEDFILDIKKSKTVLSFIKHPYPPLINSTILKRYPNISKTDSIIDLISLKYDIPVLGTFYPKKLNIKNSDFYDGMHLTPNGLEKLINNK